MHSKITIIGSGPAGYTAAIYAARANLKPIIITGNLHGGQLLYTHQIENFPAVENVSGIALINTLQRQAENLNVQMIYEKVTKVNFNEKPFLLELSNGENINTDSVVVATGASPRWLNIAGEDKFKGHGISVCATCDGFFYRDKNVMVIGSGNTAMYEAVLLSSIANHVTILSREAELTGESKLRQQIQDTPNIEVIQETIATSFKGDSKLRTVSTQNTRTLEVQEIDIDGVFIAIGQTPNSEIFAGQLDLDANGYIATDMRTKQTSVAGIYAAGDVQEKVYRQAIIACGSGAIAALEAEKYLIAKKT